jgi:hypothetical protein
VGNVVPYEDLGGDNENNDDKEFEND